MADTFNRKKQNECAAETEDDPELNEWLTQIVMDEINNAINYELIDVHSVVEMLNNKPKRLHVVLTGRYAKPEIIDVADTVTEMKVVKHAYEKGIKAAKGIEF